MRCTGMIQLFGTTYRILQVRRRCYQVVRLHDEAVAGSFSCGRTLQVAALAVDSALMMQLAGAAVYFGRTSWMGPGVSP